MFPYFIKCTCLVIVVSDIRILTTDTLHSHPAAVTCLLLVTGTSLTRVLSKCLGISHKCSLGLECLLEHDYQCICFCLLLFYVLIKVVTILKRSAPFIICWGEGIRTLLSMFNYVMYARSEQHKTNCKLDVLKSRD